MKRKLYTQIANEWRSNVWMVVEMAIVSVVMWFIADLMSLYTILASEDLGYDTEHVYMLNWKHDEHLSDSIADDEDAGESDTDNHASGNKTNPVADDLKTITRRLKADPAIEEVAFTYCLTPFKLNLVSGSILSADGEQYDIDFNSERSNGGMPRVGQVTPGYFTLLRIHGVDGHSPTQLDDIINRGGMIAADNIYNDSARANNLDPHYLIGHKYNIDESNTTTLQAFISPIKRYTYEKKSLMAAVIFPMKDDNLVYSDLLIRVRQDYDQDFVSQFRKTMDERYKTGSTFLTDITPMSEVRKSVEHEQSQMKAMSLICALFLLVNIFLGLLGAFWFRVQQRVSEIAIRKVNGATSLSIFRRLISEGLLILATATPFAAIVDCMLYHYRLCLSTTVLNADWSINILMIIIVFAVMALMVCAGIYLPARRAMRLSPATAITEE